MHIHSYCNKYDEREEQNIGRGNGHWSFHCASFTFTKALIMIHSNCLILVAIPRLPTRLLSDTIPL